MESTGIKKALALFFAISVFALLFFVISQILSLPSDSGEPATKLLRGMVSPEFARGFRREALRLYHEQLPFWFGGLSLLNLSIFAFLLRGSSGEKRPDTMMGTAIGTLGILAFAALIIFLATTRGIFIPEHLFSPLNGSFLLGLVVYFFVLSTFGQERGPDAKTLLMRILLIDGIGAVLLLLRIPMVGIVLLTGNLLFFLVRSFRFSSTLLTIGYTAILTGLFFDGWHVYRHLPSTIGFFAPGLLIYLVCLFFELLRTSRKESSALRARIDSLQTDKTIQRLHLQEKEEAARKDSETLQTFEQLILTTNALFEKALLVKEDYLPELLEHARLLIPEADAGILALLEKGRWHSHFVVGLSPEWVNTTPIDPSFFNRLKTHAATRFYDANVFLTTAPAFTPSHDSNRSQDLFNDAGLSFREALFTEITGEGSTLGYLLLFISESHHKRFTPTSFKVIGVLGSIASILLVSTLKEKENPNV